jgi:hypothetical protein
MLCIYVQGNSTRVHCVDTSLETNSSADAKKGSFHFASTSRIRLERLPARVAGGSGKAVP